MDKTVTHKVILKLWGHLEPTKTCLSHLLQSHNTEWPWREVAVICHYAYMHTWPKTKKMRRTSNGKWRNCESTIRWASSSAAMCRKSICQNPIVYHGENSKKHKNNEEFPQQLLVCLLVKDSIFFPKEGNKGSISILITLLQHSAGRCSQCSKASKYINNLLSQNGSQITTIFYPCRKSQRIYPPKLLQLSKWVQKVSGYAR